MRLVSKSFTENPFVNHPHSAHYVTSKFRAVVKLNPRRLELEYENMPDESDVINRVREICCCVNPNKHVFKNIFCFSKSWRVIDSWGSASLVCVRVCSLIFVIRSNFPSPGPREISARGATFIILVYIPRCIIYLTLILQKRQRVSARNASSFHSCLTDSKVYRQLSKSNKSLSFFIELLR